LSSLRRDRARDRTATAHARDRRARDRHDGREAREQMRDRRVQVRAIADSATAPRARRATRKRARES